MQIALCSASLKPDNGWIQTLFREKVKSQSRGNRSLNSESASKIMPVCGV